MWKIQNRRRKTGAEFRIFSGIPLFSIGKLLTETALYDTIRIPLKEGSFFVRQQKNSIL